MLSVEGRAVQWRGVRPGWVDLDDVYRSGRSWTELRWAAGFGAPVDADARALARAVGRMLHVDDPDRVGFYTEVLRRDTPPRSRDLDDRQQRLLMMLHFDFWGRTRKFEDLDEAFARVWPHAAIRDELVQLLPLLEDRSTSLPLDSGLAPHVPLRTHQRYTRDEVIAALGAASPASPPTLREGVLFVPSERVDVLFVTLQKTEKQFSPSTMYKDYAVSPTLFHWESQSTTSESSPTGQRYINHTNAGSSVCLLARESPESVPFVYLGTATYVQHERERPMRITWRLDHPIPGDFYLTARAVA